MKETTTQNLFDVLVRDEPFKVFLDEDQIILGEDAANLLRYKTLKKQQMDQVTPTILLDISVIPYTNNLLRTL